MNPDWLSKLLEYFDDCQDVAEWLVESQHDLDGRSPLQAIREGDQALVVDLVETLVA